MSVDLPVSQSLLFVFLCLCLSLSLCLFLVLSVSLSLSVSPCIYMYICNMLDGKIEGVTMERASISALFVSLACTMSCQLNRPTESDGHRHIQSGGDSHR